MLKHIEGTFKYHAAQSQTLFNFDYNGIDTYFKYLRIRFLAKNGQST